MTRLVVEKCFDGERLLSNIEVVIEQGLIKAVNSLGEPTGEELPGMLVPGFIDTQVNGAGGRLFCQQPDITTLTTMVEVHRQFGTLQQLPTVITSEWAIMEAAANAVSDYLAAGKPGVVGIHFEGPHLNPARAGIHNANKFQPLTERHIALYTRSDLGKVLVTLAPEMVPLEQISVLTQAGVIVSIGHSNADALQVERAIAAGASGCTHLFNAMSPFTSRAPGVVGTTLANDRLTAGIIVDGFHVHPTSIKAAVNAKGVQKICLVTDAMAHVGSDAQELEFEQTTIRNTEGLLTNPAGTLAGSALTMSQAVSNCVELCNLSLQAALTMASNTPASWLKLDKLGSIKPGFRASMVLLDRQCNVISSWL